MTLLDSDCPHPTHSEWRRAECTVRQDVQTFCQVRGLKPSSFYRTVWAIVLNKFTASESVTFVTHESESEPSATCEVTIEAETMVDDLLAGHSSLATSDPTGISQLECNTGVAVDSQNGKSMESLAQLQFYLLATVEPSKLWLSCLSDIPPSYQDNLVSAVEETIREITQEPHRKVHDLCLFSARNSRQVKEWNSHPMPSNMPLMVDAIRQHALQRPNHEAVCGWDGTLTYAQLDDVTTKLAYHLRSLGVIEHDKVLYSFEKSTFAPVAILSILKAGAAFVAVGPTYPTQRIQAIIEATSPRLVLTLPDFTSIFEALQVPALDLCSSLIANLSTGENEKPLPPSDPQRVAYVLFTSGSTGRPKGCVLENRALATKVSQASLFRIYPSSRVLQVAPIIFAAASVDIYLPLLVGATICIASQHDMMNNLAASMRQLRVNWATLTPSAIAPVDPSELQGLKTLGLVGEPVSAELFNKWAPCADLVSIYGQSEIVGAACISSLKLGMHPRNIGRSPTAHIWLADPTNVNRLAPVGAIGEILVEGPNLGRGYLNAPDLTAKVYIEAPEWIQEFYPGEGRRVVRSGDLARYQPDGSLVYMGRKDTQVKIRGKRVELGEIESVIRSERAPTDTVFVEAAAPRDGDGVPMLISFIYTPGSPMDSVASPLLGSPDGTFMSEAERLDEIVHAALPEYMVPSVYIPLNRIPKTASGKTDRRALRVEISGMSRQQVEAYHNVGSGPQVRPRNTTEETLHGAFAQVLNRDEDSFGIHDQFLRLGGDSIKSIRLVHLCRKVELEVSVAEIMEHGTVAQIAQLVNRSPRTVSETDSKRVAIPTAAVMEHLNTLGVSAEEVEEINSCSTMQNGILMSQLKQPEQYALRLLYQVQLSTSQSQIDLDRLQKAWQLLVQSHPMLRTVFVTNITPDIFAVQGQLKNGSIPRVHRVENDLNPKEILDRRQDCQPPSVLPQFDLHVAPSGTVIVELQLSHAVVDGMSMSIIVRDLCRLYGDAQASPPMFKFAEYVDYQQKTPTDDSVSYWKQYLDSLGSSQFPTTKSDSSVDPSKTSQFAVVPVDVGTPAEYRKFTQETETTMGNVVKLAWSLVLHVMCRTEDVCFSYLTTSRDAPIEGALEGVGPLIDLMVFRQRFGHHSTVTEALQTIQSDFISSLPHKGVALSDIRRALGYASDEVMFNTSVSHFPMNSLDDVDEELPIQLREVERQDLTEFDLSLEVMESEEVIESSIRAHTGIVPLAHMERVATLFGHAMKTIIKNSGCAIGELGLVPQEDCATIGALNNNLAQPIEKCAHDIILQHCQERPTAAAVCAWDGDWTYGELDHVSSAVAQQLKQQGVAPDTFVPVLMDKSRWVPIALLGILKAGGAFVLLEPGQPIQRLQDICADLKTNCILSSPDYHSIAAAVVSSAIVIGNDNFPVTGALESDELPKVAVKTTNAAYAVFTSGSTGKPKGVVIEHRSLATSAAAMMEYLPINGETRMFQYVSHAFDVSVLDLAVCFMGGACLCIPSAEDRQNRLMDSMNEFRVNMVALTPTISRMLQPELMTSLKTMKVIGEAFSSFDIQRWTTGAPHVKVVNMYGPAECTIAATVQSPIHSTSHPANIGYPMSSCTAWVVDSNNHHRLLPMGAVGELVLQGPIVGRGYLNRPGQTASAFISPPSWLSQFMSLPSGERLYKTGDLVQYDVDGSMHYKGRKDFQVKLRGQRLELGEVEAQLRRVFPDASDVLAEVASLNQGRTSALVAFVHQSSWSDASDSDPSAGTWVDDSGLDCLYAPCEGFSRAVAKARDVLGATLPSYMEPSIYLPLVYIPRSRSGKADRGQLRQILSAGLHERWTGDARTVTTREEPSNDMEVVLFKAVAEVLGLPETDIQAQDSFFRRGGDSVAAMTLVGDLRQQNYHLTVAQIFEHPRLGDLATQMHCDDQLSVAEIPLPFTLLRERAGSQKTVIDQAMQQCTASEEEIEDIYPCSALQHGFFLVSRTRSKGTLNGQFAYDIRADVDLDMLKIAWNEISKAHPMLRTRFIEVDGDSTCHQVVLRRTTEIEEYETPDNASSEFINDLLVEVAPGNPLLRIALLRGSSSTGHRLVMSMLHCIYDGWSQAVLMQELERAYSGISLQSVPISPFIGHLGHTDEATEQFWKQELKEFSCTVFPQVPSATYVPYANTVMTRKVPIPKIASSQITLSTKIRWTWARVISHLTNNSDVGVGLGTSGRSTPVAQIEKIVAPTLAIFPYRSHIDSTQTVSDALQESQRHYSQVLPHEHYGTSNICRVATGPTSPAALQTFLIVQPKEDSTPSSLYSKHGMLSQTGSFHIRALSLHCFLQESCVEIVAFYDEKIIPKEEMHQVLSLFDVVFQQVCHEPEALVGQLSMVAAKE